ncbi:MAG: SUMF1/EgtB/PvdO family nonheme iron enzyme [Saprospiraceae bacterium]|nr:SUMF1/EgtB/PvdO family nonheme iron enzyme [Saprospiraceae bacterium]
MAATKSRYLGVQPFKTSDQSLFFGRDEDIENLHDFILLEKLVVLFGKSGYGKSSLLNAGIIPRLLDPRQSAAFRFQPIEVRFTDYDESHSITPQETLKRMLGAIPTDPAADFLSGMGLDDTLWMQFKRRQTAAGGQFVLLFDQFEELFSYPAEQQETFRRQLAELLYTDIPKALRGQLEELDEDARRYLARPMNIKVVLAIRSDRMSLLDSMKDVLPAILHKRYELRTLTPAQGRDAIVRPAGIVGEAFNSPPFEYTEGGLHAILQALTSKSNATKDSGGAAGIEAFQLQMICEYLEGRVRDGLVPDLDGNGLPDITEDELPEMDALYENYYYRKLDELPPAAREKAQRVLEDALLAEDGATGEGRRKSVDRLDLLQMGLSESLLDELEKTYLIRRELNTVGGYNYELSHDTLLAPVLKAKKKRLEEEAARKRAEEEAAERARLRLESEKIRRARRRNVAVALFAFGLLGFAFWQMAAASKLKSEAEKLARLVVSSRLNYALKKVLALEYEAAYRTLLNSEELGVMPHELGQAMYEIAYWLVETGKFAEADMAAHRVAKLLGKGKDGTINNLEDGRAVLQRMDAMEYQRMRERYFPVMVPIPAGTAILGGEDNDDEKPSHAAILSAFKMARTETTWWQYNLFCEVTERKKPEKPAGWGGEGDNPVINVNWYDAVDYANWLSQQEGLENLMSKTEDGEYTLKRGTKGYRLPTEAEWEYAARGGRDGSPEYAGSNDIDSVAWYGENSGSRTQAVGRKKANALALFDLSGNVWEWCWDWSGAYPASAEKDYIGPREGSDRVVRGGSWGNNPEFCRVAFRPGFFPAYRSNSLGFRLVFVP